MLRASCSNDGVWRRWMTSAHITSNYGWRRDPFDPSKSNFHGGLDIKGAEGSPIRAQRDGVVTFSGKRGGYGNLVVIDHGNGLETRYGHCSRIDVKAGDPVTAGQNIAAVGHTGHATGPHLHLEARQDGKRFDPKLLFDDSDQDPER
jgi:murein DD-endopeptidase MepM/ murein hydrolase activator NlpD